MSTETTQKTEDLGFDDAFNDLDISDWTPDTPKNDRKPDKQAVKKVAEKAGFTSREPKAEEQDKLVQFNMKVKQDAIDDFKKLCKAQSPKWPQGYAFERALAALMRELEAEA